MHLQLMKTCNKKKTTKKLDCRASHYGKNVFFSYCSHMVLSSKSSIFFTFSAMFIQEKKKYFRLRRTNCSFGWFLSEYFSCQRFFMCYVGNNPPLNVSHTRSSFCSKMIIDAQMSERDEVSDKKKFNHGIYIKNTCRHPLYKTDEIDLSSIWSCLSPVHTHKWNSFVSASKSIRHKNSHARIDAVDCVQANNLADKQSQLAFSTYTLS